MKRGMKALAVLALVAAIACALVACGGSKPADKESYMGTWVLSSMTIDGREYTEAQVKVLDDMNLDVTLVFDEDGSASINWFDDTRSGTWEVNDKGECALTINGDPATATISGDVLHLEVEKNSYDFKKQ